MTTMRSLLKCPNLTWSANMVALLQGGKNHRTLSKVPVNATRERQYLDDIYKSQKGKPHPQASLDWFHFLLNLYFFFAFFFLACSHAQFKKDEKYRIYKVFKERELISHCLRSLGSTSLLCSNSLRRHQQQSENDHQRRWVLEKWPSPDV